MAYFESITAGRGGLDSFNQALNNQRYANLLLNESIGNFTNTISNAVSLFDNAKIREEALKYQRMQDFYNNKRKDEAFELEKKQAELNMDFAKSQQVLNEEGHKQQKKLNDERLKALELENKLNKKQQDWLTKAMPSAKASALVSNNIMKTPTTPITTPSANSTQATPKKTITKEEFKAIYANPMFRY
ncbi:hypothetical protein [Helicobacter pylori]|uniref:hypothetical protein n=1 Tax=Helicobacter pylori TaxID=210 RepID=UPI000C2FFC4E|nr:hypothetical protein [Helicobacter pylori]WRE56583.1 hypothetical protein KVE72_03100 [Helicobacter pylori]